MTKTRRPALLLLLAGAGLLVRRRAAARKAERDVWTAATESALGAPDLR